MHRRWNKNTVSLVSLLSANFLNQLNSHLVPYPSSFNGNWEEKVSAGKITILGEDLLAAIIILILNNNHEQIGLGGMM